MFSLLPAVRRELFWQTWQLGPEGAAAAGWRKTPAEFAAAAAGRCWAWIANFLLRRFDSGKWNLVSRLLKNYLLRQIKLECFSSDNIFFQV
jgi:hypothetical protein